MHKRASASASLHSAAFNELNSHERAYVALAFLLTSPEAGSGQTPESERPLPWAASTLLAGYFRYLDVLCTLSKFITQKVCCINMHRSIDRSIDRSIQVWGLSDLLLSILISAIPSCFIYHPVYGRKINITAAFLQWCLVIGKAMKDLIGRFF